MKIGIMGAMLEEVSQILSNMENVVKHESAERKYHEGSLYGNNSVLVFSRWGKVASATTATTLITKHNVDLILFCGVAGAIASDLNIGDVVIGSQLFQHDLDTRPIFPRYQIPLTDTTYLSPDINLVKKAEQSVGRFLNDVNTIISPQTLSKFSIYKPKVISGPIASGDQFVNGDIIPTEILKNMPDTLCVEMEGAAVAQVCAEHKIPFIIVRTISDKANHSAHIDFKEFIAEVASVYSKKIIENLYEDQVWSD